MGTLGRHLGRYYGHVPFAHRMGLALAVVVALATAVEKVFHGKLSQAWFALPATITAYVVTRAFLAARERLSPVDLHEHGLVLRDWLGRTVPVRWSDIAVVRAPWPLELVIITKPPVRWVRMPWPLYEWQSFAAEVARLAGPNNPLTPRLRRRPTRAISKKA